VPPLEDASALPSEELVSLPSPGEPVEPDEDEDEDDPSLPEDAVSPTDVPSLPLAPHADPDATTNPNAHALMGRS
jgi:hypothetical protein